MNWLEILYKICEVCLIPLLCALTGYAIQYLRTKKDEVLEKIDSDIGDKYVAMLFDTIADCVSATSQTYVDSLKQQGAFDAEAQKKAFNMTFDAVKKVLTEEAKEYLSVLYGDLDSFISTKIEAEVKAQK